MPGDEEKRSGAKEEEVMSEIIERSMEANVKILTGNEIAHANRMNALAEIAIQDAINLSRKTNDAYLTMAKQQGDAYMEQSKKQSEETLNFATQWHHHAIENNRFTLDRLYGVFPEEAVGIGTMLRGFMEYLKAEGWTPPATK